jgi:hypothetical protein
MNKDFFLKYKASTVVGQLTGLSGYYALADVLGLKVGGYPSPMKAVKLLAETESVPSEHCTKFACLLSFLEMNPNAILTLGQKLEAEDVITMARAKRWSVVILTPGNQRNHFFVKQVTFFLLFFLYSTYHSSDLSSLPLPMYNIYM